MKVIREKKYIGWAIHCVETAAKDHRGKVGNKEKEKRNVGMLNDTRSGRSYTQMKPNAQNRDKLSAFSGNSSQ